MTKKAPTKPLRMTSKDLTFATTDDAHSLQYQADVVVDVRNGRLSKNRFGPCGPQPLEAAPQGDRVRKRAPTKKGARKRAPTKKGAIVGSYLEATGYAFGKPPPPSDEGLG